MLAYARTLSGVTCKGVPQLEAIFIFVKNTSLHGSLEYHSNAPTAGQKTWEFEAMDILV